MIVTGRQEGIEGWCEGKEARGLVWQVLSEFGSGQAVGLEEMYWKRVGGNI